MRPLAAHGLGLALEASRRRPEAFATVYSALAPAVLRFFAQRTKQGQVAIDLTAETFAKAFARRSDFRGHSDQEAAAWLWSIARSELVTHWRHHRVELDTAARLGPQHPFADNDQLTRIEDLATLERAREQLEVLYTQLPKDQREAIQLHVIDELDYVEVAERLRVSSEVVRSRVSRGLHTLAERIRATWLDSDLQ